MTRAAVDRFRTARSDPASAVLEGFHALKHALRFDAVVREVLTMDPDALGELASELAPDVAERIVASADPVPSEVFDQLSPSPIPTGVVAVAERPQVDVDAVLRGDGLVVLLEDPSRVENVGAAVRAAAAASARAVLTMGPKDPWNPAALRGSAGLHYAVAVARVDVLPPSDRPVVVLDPEGDDLRPGAVPDRAIVAFGTERTGLSDELLERADVRLRIPMREGVSSLNLAVAVGVALYTGRGP